MQAVEGEDGGVEGAAPAAQGGNVGGGRGDAEVSTEPGGAPTIVSSPQVLSDMIVNGLRVL